MPLVAFKYLDFLNSIIVDALSCIHVSWPISGLNWALPLGLSFFTLQAIGYLVDVYLHRIEVEKNWWDYMLFISFFPQIASGPISKAKDLLPQIKDERAFKYNQAVQGLKWILWGMFMKVVMADRIGIYADTIFNNYEHLSGLSCFIGSLLYTLQIYGDFAGYSFMAVGVGELFGFELINNFQRPYFSQSITEFWHRWHISLSTWLKDYIYIPLGGSRCSKVRNYWNIFVTFLVSGLWHGANWTFIVWGGLHGIFQIIEKMLKLQKPSSAGITKAVRISVTFLLVNFAWVFFRMPSLDKATDMIVKMFTNHDTTIAGITPAMVLLIVMSVSIVLVKDILDEFCKKEQTLFHHQNIFVRWSVYIILTCLILTCGVFDASQFIYVNF
jgi:D-alanyl-lipoteichoic acid acyltransferase DltB (MBOAT superfamily)